MHALLLAAGESSRMGQLKALLPWSGGTLVEFQVEQLLAGGISRVVLVLGHEARRITEALGWLPRTSVVLNRDYASGKTSSVRAGLAAIPAEADALMILGVDQPRPAALIHDLRKAHRAGGALITVPAFGGRHGHPTIFARALFPEIQAIAEATQGLRAIRHRHRDRTHVLEATSPAPLLDLNTPEEYQAARAFFAALGSA